MNKKWWHDKTAYQIYPKSFCDSNGDGVGDIQGIISRLDYLQSLGVDIIWVSPCYPSPWADQGYDISDYYNVDPRFGTMDDMDQLIMSGSERHVRILTADTESTFTLKTGVHREGCHVTGGLLLEVLPGNRFPDILINAIFTCFIKNSLT